MSNAQHKDIPGTGRNSWMLVVLAVVLVIIFLVGARELILPWFQPASDLALIDSAIGATLEPLDPATAHALGDGNSPNDMVVTSVASGGPAESRGIKVGDVIEAIDGRTPGSNPYLTAALAHPRVTLIINRHGKRAMVEVPIHPADRQDQEERGASS